MHESTVRHPNVACSRSPRTSTSCGGDPSASRRAAPAHRAPTVPDAGRLSRRRRTLRARPPRSRDHTHPATRRPHGGFFGAPRHVRAARSPVCSARRATPARSRSPPMSSCTSLQHPLSVAAVSARNLRTVQDSSGIRYVQEQCRRSFPGTASEQRRETPCDHTITRRFVTGLRNCALLPGVRQDDHPKRPET